MAGQTTMPTWLVDIRTTLAATPQYVLWGNVHDLHLLPHPERGFVALPTHAALQSVFSEAGISLIVTFDPVDGFGVLPADPESLERARAILEESGASVGEGKTASVSQLRRVIRLVAASSERIALVINRASRLAPEVDRPEGEVLELFVSAEHAATTARPVVGDPAARRTPNPVVWLLDRERDLPHWVIADNPGAVRPVVVPEPDRETRRAFIADFLGSRRAFGDATPATRAEAVDDLADRCDGMSLREMQRVVQVAEDQQMPLDAIESAIRAYRVGAMDNPWRKDYLRERVRAAEGPEGIRARVRGQEAAVTKSLDILKRTVLGLSGAQAASSSRRPRGVLLLVGPTGTGKTELAKALTELIFGEGSAPVRFDMSEFSADHTDARLVGAPPGYVGFDAGGELTNAVRRNPFSLILFDEIDKANPRILDKFLQILDEGRLTDGRGSTVSFQEAILVFTSNAGMEQVNRDIKDAGGGLEALPTYSELHEKLLSAVKDKFVHDIQRPELLNRFGDNIVVFDFIRPPVTREIFDMLMGHVVRRLEAETGITVAVGADALEPLADACAANPTMGGRGIGNLVESLFVNPLARAVFDNEVARDSRVVVTRWGVVDGVAELDLERQ
jgi:energy-coupling factor transporter ATP-binding protein EcfA2